MVMNNKLKISNSLDLSISEEKISKKKAIELFELDLLGNLEPGKYETLSFIHKHLFSEIYDFAGNIRDVNISKDNFSFAPYMYLNSTLKNIDKMPQKSFEEIIEKYVEMNVAHPFREGNGRATRIWLDHMLKHSIHRVINWSNIDKNNYLLAMKISPVSDIEIKNLLKGALSDKVNDKEVFYKGVDNSFLYEGFNKFTCEQL